MQTEFTTGEKYTIAAVADGDRVVLEVSDSYGDSVCTAPMSVGEADQVLRVVQAARDTAAVAGDERVEAAAQTLATERGIPIGAARRLIADGLIDPDRVLAHIDEAIAQREADDD